MTVSSSLVAGTGGSGTPWDSKVAIDGGNNIDSDPLFVQTPDPATAPTTQGDLQLKTGSPAINVGNNTVNLTLLDLAHGNRHVGIIDLGGYEHQPDSRSPPLREGSGDRRRHRRELGGRVYEPAGCPPGGAARG